MRAGNHLSEPTMVDIDPASDDQTLFDFFVALAENQGIKRQLAGQLGGDRLMVSKALSKLISSAPRGDAIASSFGAQPRLASHVNF